MPDHQAYATQQVPRYTSYPTAPHFTDAVGSDDYAAWLKQLPPDQPISLYLHVPFCRQVCWYCGCNMKLAKRYQPIADYCAALLAEINLMAKQLPGRMPVAHLHWGGGTPTALEPDDLARVMARVRRRFEVLDNAEMAIESDPRTLTGAMINRIGTLGFNRASFGVQEFDLKVQTAINRIQPPEMVRSAIDGLRAVGVGAINFDLIYGLPYQTEHTLIRTIELAADMKPDRIALFGYAHVPWKSARQRKIPENALPGQQERTEQAASAAEHLQSLGYRRIGLDHFALPDDPLAIAAESGQLRRNFQGYTTDRSETLLGLGASSVGRTPSGYVQNLTETGAWSRKIANGQLPIARGCVRTLEDQLRARVIEEILCQGDADLDMLGTAFDCPGDWYADHLKDLDRLAKDGLVYWNHGRIRLTEQGRIYARNVAAVFDTFLRNGTARHSVSV